METIALSRLHLDGRTQPRAALNFFTIDEYAETMRDGTQLPPIVAFCDGAEYWVADGFHRARAAEQIGRDEIEVDVRQGTLRDAILYSVGANAVHGMRRTNADKRRAVITLLRDKEWARWSDGRVAKQCGVSDRFVANVREQVSPNHSEMRKVKRSGTVYTMNTANIGERIAPEDRDWVRQAPLSEAVMATMSRSPQAVEKAREVIQAAEADPDHFAPLVEQMDRTGKVDGPYRQLRRMQDEERILSTEPVAGKYRTILADPPWEYELDLAGRARPMYALMSREELLALPVPEWSEGQCHLYLWTTNAFIPRAIELMAAWGFDYKTLITWVKPRIGMGSYFRNTTEQCLFGVKGSLTTRVKDVPTHFEAPVSEHSEKPEEIYRICERASYPPYLEIFARKEREGWQAWGSGVAA